MSIDFSTLQGLTIPEGVVTQIADASGRVLWALNTGGPVILEVEKITSDTYAGETTYTGEQFILLDIYPKTNGTVKITYGGLTKTITDTSGAEEPNAQQVFFGTFNGVSDSVATPASGELTIEGDYYAFGSGSYVESNKSSLDLCGCITSVAEWGEVNIIPNYGFFGCDLPSLFKIPDNITSIGQVAFSECTGVTSVEFPDNITEIPSNTFRDCASLTNFTVHENIIGIGPYSFNGCTGLTKVIVLAKTPPTLDGTYVFDNCPALATIIVPKGSGTTYKAAENWSEYADLIVEAS